MASSSFVEGLDHQLTCSSCKEIFTDPKTLSCLHTYCLGCIRSYQHDTVNNNQGIMCPECNIATAIPEGNPEKLQPSSYIDAILLLYNAVKYTSNEKRESLPNCSCCQKSASLDGFCEQCSGLVCGECVNIHKTKKHKNHHIIMLKDFREDDLESYIKTRILCQEKFHGKNGARKVEYYCEERGCQRCICRRCFLLEHRKHKLLDMKEVVQKLEKKTNEDLNKIDKLVEELGEDLEDSKKQMSRFDQEIKVAKQKIHNAVEALIKKAKYHEDTMVQTLDARLEEYKTMNIEEQSDILKRKRQLDDFRIRCQTLIDKNKWELVRTEKDLKQFYQAFSERPSLSNNDDIKRNVTVHYVTDYVICQSVKNMGKIVESVTDDLHSPIESLKEARYSFVNDMDYVTRSSTGDMSMSTRWKRTFLWSRLKSTSDDNNKLKPPRMMRAHSVA